MMSYWIREKLRLAINNFYLDDFLIILLKKLD